jgi:Ca2+-binding RTX toxin-like protein
MGMESMEQRKLMAADVYLDFDGATQAQVNEACSAFTCWRDRPRSGGLVGFQQGFGLLDSQYGRFSFLDFDGNGRLNASDGSLAREGVLDRVRQDFAPYAVNITALDSPTAVRRMRASATGDALIFVNGGSTAVGGQAPVDVGNGRDDVGAAGDTLGIANWIVDNYGGPEPRDAFLNIISNFISHEVGHTFGLNHLSETRSPSLDGRTLMDPFIWVNNVGFTDQTYWTDAGSLQNEHDYLSDTVGGSTQAWAAVLIPGTVTVQGSAGGDSFTVDAATDNDVIVQDRLRGSSYTYRVDVTAAPDINSLNQFNVPISQIQFRGGSGNDTFAANDGVRTTIIAFGDAGNDTLRGGGVRDYLFGGDGWDVLYGNGGDDNLTGDQGTDVLRGGAGVDTLRGGAGHDFLYGDDDYDWIYGDEGNDYLNGGAGADRLYGYAGDDTLDGTADGAGDLLYGGSGADRFLDHQQLYYDVLRRRFRYASEDDLADVTAEDTREVRSLL